MPKEYITGRKIWEQTDNRTDMDDLKPQILSRNYSLEKIPILPLLDKDPDLKQFIEAELYTAERKVNSPIIIGDVSRGGPEIKNTVIDGFHRIGQALYNNETEVLAYVPEPDKAMVTYFNEKRKTTPTVEVNFPLIISGTFIEGTNISVWNIQKIDVKK